MPVTYEIDPSRHLVRTLASGLVRYRELECHVVEEEHDDAGAADKVMRGTHGSVLVLRPAAVAAGDDRATVAAATATRN